MAKITKADREAAANLIGTLHNDLTISEDFRTRLENALANARETGSVPSPSLLQPWEPEEDWNAVLSDLYIKGIPIATIDGDREPDICAAIAARLVTCLKACSGISTTRLVSHSFRWIDATESVPPPNKLVLIATYDHEYETYFYSTGYHTGSIWETPYEENTDPSYWQPILRVPGDSHSK